MYTVLIVFHIVLAAALIAIVLVQRGPGATMGAAFGAGASGTVFGSRGAASFLTRATSWLAVGFFAVSLAMAVLAARSGNVDETAEDLGVAGQMATPQAEQDQAAGNDAAGEDEPAPEASEDEEFLTLPEEQDGEDDGTEPPAG